MGGWGLRVASIHSKATSIAIDFPSPFTVFFVFRTLLIPPTNFPQPIIGFSKMFLKKDPSTHRSIQIHESPVRCIPGQTELDIFVAISNASVCDENEIVAMSPKQIYVA